MTNDELIAKIKAEIERLAKRADRRTDKDHASHNAEMERYGEDYWNGYGDLAYALLSFLSTLDPEKPVPADLEEAADNHIREVADAAGHPGWDWETQDIADAFIAGAKWQADHTPLPEDTVLFNKGVEEGKMLMMDEWLKDRDGCFWDGVEEGKKAMKEQMLKDAVRWLVDDDYDPQTDKGRFLLGSAGLGYNGYYIPYSDLLKLPKEGDQ